MRRVSCKLRPSASGRGVKWGEVQKDGGSSGEVQKDEVQKDEGVQENGSGGEVREGGQEKVAEPKVPWECCHKVRQGWEEITSQGFPGQVLGTWRYEGGRMKLDITGTATQSLPGV